MFIDLSQYYSKDAEGQLYDVMEAPLGILYLLTYLKNQFGPKVDGKIIKVRVDFDDYNKLKEIVDVLHSFSSHEFFNFNRFAYNDENFINPSKWNVV